MALRKNYIKPLTEVCILNTAADVMVVFDPTQSGGQLANGHEWEEEILNEGLEDNLLKYPSFFPKEDPNNSLWEKGELGLRFEV